MGNRDKRTGQNNLPQTGCSRHSLLPQHIHPLYSKFDLPISCYLYCVAYFKIELGFSVLRPTAYNGRSQWPRGLRRRSAAARLLRLWVRIPPRAWMSLCCECCVLSGRGLCDELLTRPEESYRLWCVVECDLETS